MNDESSDSTFTWAAFRNILKVRVDEETNTKKEREENSSLFYSLWKGSDDSDCPNALGISSLRSLSFTDDESSIGENEYSSELTRKTPKRVQFADVQTREYNLVLDENSSKKLYPITLGWEHSNTVVMNIDDHISSRQADKWNRVIVDPTKIGRKAFRLNAHLRFARIHSVSGIEKLDLYNMEVSRHRTMQDQMAMSVK